MLSAIAGRRLLIGHLKSSINQIRYASVVRAMDQQDEAYKVGDIIHGYKLEHIDYIKELNIKPYYLRHEITGAEHLHVHKDGDSNNVFAVSLRTTPKNSTGVAHILEHIALSGSKKYPVPETFMRMTTRSLATFMNAMTGPDFTVYPFSTQNKQDYENLLRVYLDAVFFPRLRPVDFRQEGWRLEHEKPDQADSPIIIKGVVYNEMKGVFSSTSSLYSRQLLNNLFPETTYRYESGGDPEHITKLSHEELMKFYKTHYHPTNAKFFTYGNFPFDEHLQLINELVLSKFHENVAAREQSLVQDQEPWTEPKTVNITCPFDPLSAHPEKQTTTSISYLLPTYCTDIEQMFSLQILCSLLVDGPNAPFYKSLIESGLGSDYSPSSGFGNYTKQPYFSVGLQNIRFEDVPKVHDIIEKTLIETKERGFPQERVDALLHDIELSLKHVGGNFGLGLIMSLESLWNHDGNAIDYLKINNYVEKFKSDLAGNKNYWSDMIQKYFISNQHRLILNMNPDHSYEDKRKERERVMLNELVSNLDETEKQTLLYEGMELLKIQDSQVDASVLPCLEASKDISRALPYRTELKFDQHKGVNIQMAEQPTNEVVYFKAILDVNERLQENGLIDYLPLFCDVATKLGAGAYDRHQLAQQAQLTTGGLGVSLLLVPDLSDTNSFKNQVSIGSHCLRRNVGKMFELWTNVFKEIHFKENQEYLMQLVKASAADLADGISQSGQSYAMKRSAASLSDLSALDERLSGLQHVARMKDMAGHESIESITNKLQAIARIVLDPYSMKCALNAEPEAMEDTLEQLKKFIAEVQKIHSESDQSPDELIKSSTEPTNLTKVEDLEFPFQTHFVAKSFITVPRMHKDFAKLVIMSKLVSSKFLLKEIREKGGAYGAGLRLSNSGIMSFFSYRDPETEKTLHVYNAATEWVEKADGYTDKDIEESKLGVFQDIDKPVPPGRRGNGYFSLGLTDDMQEKFRKRLLDVSVKDVRNVGAKYLKQMKVGVHII